MRAEPIRNALREEPFRPFQVHTASGRSYIVPHPEFALLPPTGRILVLVDENDAASVLDLGLIESIQYVADGENGQNAKAGDGNR